MVDFHVHSVYSDGTDEVEKIVGFAVKHNFSYLSITDHDTVLSQPKAIGYSEKKLFYISGIEISAEYPLTLHILGYNYDVNDSYFVSEIKKLREFRDERNQKITKNFQNLGYNISLDEVTKEANGNIVGRPHFASVLVKKGYFTDRKDVFNKLLSKGKPAYENKKRFSIEKSINLIHKAGGLAVWAHPYSAVESEDQLLPLMKRLVDLGIDGMEAYYSSYENNMINNLVNLSKRFNVFCTAGSDYHGSNKSVALGVNIETEKISTFLKRLN